MFYLIALILIIIGGIIVSYISAIVDMAKSNFPLPLKIAVIAYMIIVIILMIVLG